MAGVDRYLIWSARNMGASESEVVWQIVLPAALPQIHDRAAGGAAHLLSSSPSWPKCLMGGYGLGGAMVHASRFANSQGVFAGIVEIAVVGYVLVKVMTLVRRRLLI